MKPLPLILAFFLLVAHWLGDYTPLSTPWMLAAKKNGKPVGPIAAHAAVHAALMLAVLLAFSIPFATAIALAGFQFIAHWMIDIGNGRLAVAAPITANPANKSFWAVFGLDQLAHQIVILAMVFIAFR